MVATGVERGKSYLVFWVWKYGTGRSFFGRKNLGKKCCSRKMQFTAFLVVVAIFLVSVGASHTTQSKALIGASTSTPVVHSKASISRLKGGSVGSVGNNQMKARSEDRISLRQLWLGSWGILQVVAILGNALKRLIPIALQPFQRQDLLPYQWITLISWALFMVYTEGYKAFHLKFSPLVVKRAFRIVDNTSFMNIVLSGPFSMGLFGATKKRMIISWSISLGVLLLVKLVKELPYPWRSVVDAGVVAGLGVGTLSIIFHTLKVFFTKKLPDIDDEIPPSTQ